MDTNRKIILLENEVIEPGEKKLIKILVGSLPSGTKIYIHVFIIRSMHPGPSILLVGGMHGDEINGTEIVRRIIDQYPPSSLNRGTLICVPLLNVFGFIHFMREVAEGKDVNRSFPGSSKGSLAARIAYALQKKILPLADNLIDFHTGGDHRYNYPQIRYSPDDEHSLKLAKSFSAPFLLVSKLRNNSLRQLASKQKIPSITFEGGEGSRFDGYSIAKALEGVARVLFDHKMISASSHVSMDSKMLQRSRWIRAHASGIFIWSRSSGAWINKGEILGTISDPDNSKKEYVRSKESGYIIGHNNAPVVNTGDALFHVAS